MWRQEAVELARVIYLFIFPANVRLSTRKLLRRLQHSATLTFRAIVAFPSR